MTIGPTFTQLMDGRRAPAWVASCTANFLIVSVSWLAVVVVTFTTLVASQASASATVTLPYSGRLTQASGSPLEGTVTIEARFWSAVSDGSQLGITQQFETVALTSGVFTIELKLSTADAAQIFGASDESVFIEITANGKAYPRQRFSYVPYSLRVPVDGQTIKFDGDGRLAIAVGASSGSNQFLTKDSAGNLIWASPVVTALQNATVSTTAPTSGQVLRYDGAQWVAADQVSSNSSGTFTTLTTTGNVGIGSTAPSAKLDISGQIKIQGGSPGAGRVLTSDANGLATWSVPAATGITAVMTGTGLLGGAIATSGTISLSDTTVTPGSYSRANITVDAQGRLTAAQSAAAITDADIATSANISQSKVGGLSADLASKEPAITAGTAAQFWRGDKTWQPLNTSAVAEGSNLYFTPARALSSLTASAPITYSTVTGTIGITQATATSNGYLSSSDWSTFDGKQNALGFTPLNKSGDTLTGALDAGSFEFNNIGNIQMAASKTFGLSNNAADPTGLTSADKGRTWFNSSTNQIKYWDGSGAQALGLSGSGLSSFNGQAGNTQTLGIPGTSGTAPSWSSLNNNHTLNIPMASANGVTAGLLSNADYVNFVGKVGSVAPGVGIVVSSAGSTATVSLSTSGNVGTYAKVTTDAYGRVSSGTTLTAADIPPHAAALITSGQLSPANGGTGLNAAPTDGQLLIGSGGNFALGNLAAGTKAGVTISSGAGSITLDTAQDIRPTASPTFASISAASLNVPILTQVGSGAPAVSVAGQGKIYFDQSDNEFKISQNGGAYTRLASGGSVTSVATGIGLSGGPLTTTGTISLSNTSVSPGSYTRANITVDAQGRLTAAQSATAITDADISTSANIAQSKVSGLSTDLASKEPSITAGTTAQYWRGDKTWQSLTTAAVAEGSNLYFTPARAISSLTASAPITYSTVTGAIGITQATAASNGYLSSVDWSSFNAKQNALGYTPLNKAGDTLNGALNAGDFDLSNTGNIQMSSSKTLALSNNVADPAGLTATDKGRTWFNSSTNQIKYWDGSATKALGVAGSGLGSFNGQTGNTQTFGLPGSSGTSPNWSSAADVHTLNIPLASAANVTAGLLSNADYTAFNSKVNAVNAGTGVTVATASGTATVSLTTVGTAGNYAKVTTDAYGRVTAGTTLSAADVPAPNWAAPGAIGSTTPNSGSFTTLATTGNIGIGTTNPGAALEIAGQIKIQGGAPGAGKVLTSDADGLASWGNAAVGTITAVTAGSGLTGGGTSGSVSIAADVGTTANKIVQLDAGAKLPAVDGSALINLSPTNLASPVGVNKGGTGLVSGTSGGIPYFSATSTIASSAALTANGVVLGGGAGAAPTATAVGAANSVLRVPGAGAAPAFGAIDLGQSAAVGGTLSVGNGGLGTSLLLTGGAGQYLKQTASGANVTVGTILASDLPQMVGDSGAGGTKGAVPAPASGDAASGKYLKADGSWSVPTSTVNWSAPGGIGSSAPNTGVFSSLVSNGNLGVGIANPASMLHVAGANVSDVATGTMILSRYAYGGGPGYRASALFHYCCPGGSDALGIGVAGEGGSWDIPTALSQTKMVVRANGSVGIGAIAPNNKLDIAGSVAIGSTYGGGTSSGGSAGPSNGLIVQGSVGVGTTSPDKQLDVVGTVASDNYIVRRISDGNETTMSLASDASNYLRLTNVSGNRGFYINTYTADGNRDIFFAGSGGSVAGTPGMIRALGNTNIIVDGNIGVGTTSPTQKLSVAGTIESTTGGVKFPDGSVQVVAMPLRNGASAATAGRSCFQILNDGYSTGSGTYWLAPIGLSAFQVYCDMTTDNGGWTLIARNNATTTFTNFNKNWASYKAGFGDLTTNTSWGWLGNDRIHMLTRGGVELIVANNVQQHFYKSFLVENEANKYGMTVLSTANSKDNGYFQSYQGGMLFSTYDQDNDAYGASNCAVEYASGWWHRDCFTLSLAGSYLSNVHWRNAAGNYEYVTWIEMWVR